MTSEQKASGISPEMSELDVLKEELTGLEDIWRREGEWKWKKKQENWTRSSQSSRYEKEGQGGTVGNDKQKAPGKKSAKKKARRSTSDTIEYLKERNEAEFALRREQFELKKKEQEEEAAKRQEDLMKMMVQQNQIMLQVISKLLHK